jgi:peptidoglycan-associated lipoprotein
MINVRGSALVVVPLLVAALGVAGCPKRPGSTGVATAPAPGGSTSSAAGSSAAGSARASGQASSSAGAAQRKDVASLQPSDFKPVGGLKDIRFDFDKYEIRAGEARTLDANAGWLKTNAGVQVLIEGHCDERGTLEYNLALGDRRARAAMSYLVGQGISASRMRTVSYGEARPLCDAHDESCWAMNRRDHFLGSGN